MAQAWLDSLSEDWVSQHESEPSFSAPDRQPDNSNETKDTTTSPARPKGSRIPKPSVQAKRPETPSRDSSRALSERSLNDINITGPRRAPPSKLSQEIKPEARGRPSSRAASLSASDSVLHESNGSVVHNTVHKASSTSPARKHGDTPEWKRRLVYGELSVGEQPDLFTSHATGLANIFNPPPVTPRATNNTEPTESQYDEEYEAQRETEEEEEEEEEEETFEEGSAVRHNLTMPSSPPVYNRDPSTVEIHVDDSAVNELPPMPKRQAPKGMRYRRNDESDVPSQRSDHGEEADFDSRSFGHSDEAASAATAQHLIVENDADLRKVSGQTVLNEDFSPILLTRRNAEDGQPMFTPVEVPPSVLRKKLEKLRRNQMVLMAESDDALDESGRLVENTDEMEDLGGFINLRRGGRSAEGSFRHRLLSSALDTSALNLEESIQASTPKQFPTVRMEVFEGKGRTQLLTPQYPRAPRPSPEKRGGLSQGSQGSPLKLFQPYDTFTNQTLLRRLSQFEGQIEEVSPSINRQSSQLEGMEGEFAVDDGRDYFEDSEAQASQTQDQSENNGRQPTRSVSQFGAGDLDGYEFSEDMSYSPQRSPEEADDTNPYEQRDASSRQAPPRSPIFKMSHSSSPLSDESVIVTRKRGDTGSSAASSQRLSKFPSLRSENPTQNPLMRASLLVPNHDQLLSTPKRRDTESKGKRARPSPEKESTPKRKRTLHKSDIAYASVEQSNVLVSVQMSHQQMQSVIGKKRKDSRGEDYAGPADPNILSQRQMLRPRTPTPSQRSSLQRDRIPSGEDEDEEYSDLDDSNFDETPASGFGIPSRVGTQMDTDRKPSIQTEDFINEANKIMAMIRNKTNLGSGLASVEESESEHMHQAQVQEDEDSYEESTKEPFSRPPSREGPPLQRISTRQQDDPEVVMRLKQYEEGSDMGDLITSSMRSVGAVLEQYESPGQKSGAWSFTSGEEVVSDPPGIRISRGASHKSTESIRDGFLTTGSNGSGGSTSRSYPTGSSRASETKKTIAPESVAHFIPDQVGNMVLDRQRNIWIKRKQAGSITKVQKQEVHNWLPSEGSEEDPFADIPDLSVDMTMEMRNLRIQNARKAEEARLAEEESQKGADTPKTSPPKGTVVKGSLKGSIKKLVGPSPLRSIVFQPDATPSKSSVAIKEIHIEDDVEHEIKIHEGRANTPRKRNLTITFSSPVASIIQDLPLEQKPAPPTNNSPVEEPAEELSIGSIMRGRRNVSVSKGRRRTSRSRSGSRLPARQLSVRGEAFVPRPVSRIEEREEETEVNVFGRRKVPEPQNMELSIVGETSVVQQEQEEEHDENRRNSISFLFTTPARPHCPSPGVDAANLIAEYVGNLSLSPMSDFTIHHAEQTLPLEVSYVVSNHHLKTNADLENKRVMSLTVKKMVEKLAEVQPFEPYWEDMQELDLQEKGLESLHQLESFCGQLVKVDASHNDIRNLGGIPSSVRQLRITDNKLTSLTSWSHLMNLQYVDVSNNGLTSLSAFKDLVHLRSLRADNNAITSLDGLKYHDGLQILRVRGNKLTGADFDNTALHRLTELDLRDNQIKSVSHIDQLTALSTLYLDKNELESLPITEDQQLPGLAYLSISDNNLTSISLLSLPSLRLLHADRNKLTTLSGFEACRRLDSLSLREQRITAALATTFLNRAYEIRKLYLSGNLLEDFNPQVDFLNLQLLELANCGLASLPAEMGCLMPNLRAINLNFNALTSLAPLQYIPRLKRLAAAGNRLSYALGVVNLLSGFPHLKVLDLRDNPMTQGFYAPVRVMVVSSGANKEGEMEKKKGDDFTLPDQDVEVDGRYSSRCDLDTRMKRRVYEVLIQSGCRRVKILDGLNLTEEKAQLRDAVWRGLVSRGLMDGDLEEGVVGEGEQREEVAEGEEKGFGGVEGDEEQQREAAVEAVLQSEEKVERWQAEDSFA